MSSYYSERELWIEKADYKEQPMSQYKGIPFIEALPIRKDEYEFIGEINQPFEYDHSDTELPAHHRIDGPSSLSTWFMSQKLHYDLYLVLDNMIRQGYRQAAMRIYKVSPQTPLGGSILAPTGVGKSISSARCLQLMPDIIIHDREIFEQRYPDEDFYQYQIPVLMITAPFDGSIQKIKEAIIESLIALLGDDRIRSNITDDIKATLKRYKVGLLVIDEVPFLLQSRQHNYNEVINYLATLRTRLCIPVFFIGTLHVYEIFKNSSQARRIIGPQRVLWLPMLAEGKNMDGTHKLSYEFTEFVQEMWQYQWVQDPTEEPSEAVLQAFYECTAGICDFIIKLFQIIQIKLISDHYRLLREDEEITPELIFKVAETEFYIINDRIREIVKNPGQLETIFDMGMEGLPEIKEIAEKYQTPQPEDDHVREHHSKVRKKQSRRHELIHQLKGMDIDPDRAELLARCVINEMPDAGKAEQTKKALDLHYDPEFDKQQAPHIPLKEVDLSRFDTRLFRDARPKKGEVFSAYDQLKKKGLITNLRDGL